MTTRTEAVLTLTRDGAHAVTREIAVEAPVAIEVNGIGYAVLMATPAALANLATGFLLTERLIDTAADLIDLDPFETPAGWICLLYTSPSPRDQRGSRMPSSA